MKSLFTLLILATTIFAYTVPDSLCREAAKVNDLLINCQFSQARKIADQLLAKDSTEPLYYYLKIASVGLETLDRDEVVLKSQFMKTYEKGMALLSKEKSLKQSSYHMMLQGFLQTSLSSYHLLDGKYGAAVSVGKDGLASVEKARTLDKSNADVDYYLGFFSYARGELKKRVPILFWLQNSSKTGIIELQRCSDKGLFMNAAADMVLVDVLVREGELARSEKMLLPLMKKYPQSRFLLWTKTRLEIARGQTDVAAKTFTTLSKSYSEDAFYHNAILTAHESLKLLKSNPVQRKKVATELSAMIPAKSVSTKDQSAYAKLIQLSKE